MIFTINKVDGIMATEGGRLLVICIAVFAFFLATPALVSVYVDFVYIAVIADGR
jgi:hypothetical protein